MLVSLFPNTGIFVPNAIVPGFSNEDMIQQIKNGAGQPAAGLGASFGLLNNNGSAVFSTAAGTAEQIAFTYTLPAGIITQPGQQLRISTWGVTANNANAKTLKLYHGATVLSVTLVASAAGTFYAQMNVTALGLASQAVMGWGYTNATLAGQVNATAGSDTFAGVVIKASATDAVSSAGDIVVYGMCVEAMI